MDLGIVSPPPPPIRCCDCGCDCSLSTTWIRSVKRKHEEFANEKRFHIPELDIDLNTSSSSNAKVEIENECELLRETVSSQQESIQALYDELEEERNAASTAASEAMSMILRLQSEKSEIQMELRQFKRFAEDKMEHDQQELLGLEDLVYKREQTIQALTYETQAYRHRMMSYGVDESDVDGDKLSRNNSMIENENDYDNGYDNDLPTYDYPPLKCSVNENPESDVDVDDVEKYPLSDAQDGRENLKTLERRISLMERNPKSHTHYSEKVVVDDTETNNNYSAKVKVDDNETNDRVYTIDSVHHHSSDVVAEEKLKDHVDDDDEVMSLNQPDLGDPDITKLYARLQALEVDRESMRQAIMSMRTEKTQMVLLKEIAQHLSKDVIAERRLLPLRKVETFSFLSGFKWITSFVLWRKRARRSKYMNEMSGNNNTGLQMLLETTPRIQQWRCLSRTQV